MKTKSENRIKASTDVQTHNKTMPTFQKVVNIKDLEGSLLRVDIDCKPIVLAMVQGNVYAMDAVCSHESGPLEDGSLEGYELKCPWHCALFDVRNALRRSLSPLSDRNDYNNLGVLA
jgi:nitrite reductase/ring-hydroxylating ferredoxin subunit